MNQSELLMGALGAVLGLLADRLAARWPAHEDGRVRGLDWRTAVLVVAGAAAYAALASRWSESRDLLILGGFFAVLIALLATDLDQRLLPDLLTLPMIPVAAVVLLLGWDPLLAGKSLGLLSGLIAALGAPAGLLLSSRVFGGAIGMGDLKLAVSLGLMCGVFLLLAGFLAASMGFAAVLLVLLAARRIGLKSAIPFGPLLIVAGLVGALLP
jgi:leader peptidase (prepilin peptidase) / N-methyltransferase